MCVQDCVCVCVRVCVRVKERAPCAVHTQVCAYFYLWHKIFRHQTRNMESTWPVVTWSAAKWRWVTRPQVNRTVSLTNWYFVVLPLMLKEKSAFFSVGTLLWSGYDLRDLRPEWLLPSITANGQYYTSSCKSFFSLSDWWMDGLVEWVIDGWKNLKQSWLPAFCT